MKKNKCNIRKMVALLSLAIVMSANCVAYAGTGFTDPDLTSDAYKNVYQTTGSNGEAAWYVYGRAQEKLGIKLPLNCDEKEYWSKYTELYQKGGGFNYGYEPRANSILVWSDHVAFCENIEKDIIYFTEANWNSIGYNGQKSMYNVELKERNGQVYIGCIYLEKENLITEGKYYIKLTMAGAENLCLDVPKDSREQKIPIKAYKYHAGGNQKFELEYKGNGYVAIKCSNSGLYLDVEGGTGQAGSNIIQHPYNGKDNQLWRVIQMEDGTVMFVSKLYGLVLDVYNRSIEEGTNLIAFDKTGYANQRFKLEIAD